MKPGGWWNRLGIFWQVYILTALLFSLSVTLVPGFAAPLVAEIAATFGFDKTLTVVHGTNLQWYEVMLWLVGVGMPTLCVSYFVARLVETRLRKMDAAARRLRRGDFTTRIDDAGEDDDDDAFNQVAKTFNRMAATLEASSRNEIRLLADISHELRSPLTRMTVSTALLGKENSPEEFKKLLQGLENDVNDMNNLVAILLEKGRSRSREREVQETIDISQVAVECVDRFRPLGKKSGKFFVANIQPGLEVMGSPYRVRLIFENLLNNALFYTPPGSGIFVTVYDDGATRAAISIRDHGPGIPEDKLPHIFRAFYRVDDSRARESGGVGLGLALVKEAVVTMAGEIRAENSHPGLNMLISIPFIPSRFVPTSGQN